jgi:acetyltransferase-like isoleucine patch superfamily enzyme
MRKFLKILFSNPWLLMVFLLGRFYAFRISLKRSVEVAGGLVITGKPIIDIAKDSHLYIGKKVTLNSRNRGYHINMHSPVKLFADKPGATITIGDNTRIHGTCIHAYNSISIGKNCLIAANCQIIDGNGHDLSFMNVSNRVNTHGGSKPVTLEDSVWLGANTIILPGVTVGMGSVIAANSLVTKDIPSMVLAGGNPAVVLKQY